MPKIQLPQAVVLFRMSRCEPFASFCLPEAQLVQTFLPLMRLLPSQDAAQDRSQQQEQLAAADPPVAAYSPDRPLITNKSNKLEWQEGQAVLCLIALTSALPFDC